MVCQRYLILLFQMFLKYQMLTLNGHMIFNIIISNVS